MAAGNTEVRVASTAGFHVGDTIVIDGGGTHERAVIVGIRALRAESASASGGVLVLASGLANNYPIDSSVTLSVTTAPNTAPTAPLAATPTVPPTAAPTVPLIATPTLSSMAAGNMEVHVPSTSGFHVGDSIVIEGGGIRETEVIVSIQPAKAAWESPTLVFDRGLAHDFPIDSSVILSGTTAPTTAPTAPPTATPTAPPPVAVTGDPHVTNVEGQRFNLVRTGVHELLRLPRRSGTPGKQAGSEALLEVLGSVESEQSCAEPFVRQLDLSGLWLQQSGPLVLRAGGLSLDSEDAIVLHVNGSRVDKHELTRDARLRGVLQVTEPRAKRGKQHGAKVRRDKFFSVQMRLPGATLTVDFVHRDVPGSSLNHLDFNVADLPKLMDVGGVLGRDDHALAASPSAGCRPTQGLVGQRADFDARASLLSASYEHK
jgi:hypothetical protein